MTINYEEWLKEQTLEFRIEILKNPEEFDKVFKDHNYKPISLEELKKLDDIHNT
jgi:hypothetical protein